MQKMKKLHETKKTEFKNKYQARTGVVLNFGHRVNKLSLVTHSSHCPSIGMCCYPVS